MSAPGFARFVDLALQLEADAGRPDAELRRRDRALGQELARAGVPARARVQAWLEHVRPASGGVGARSARALRGLGALLALLGAAAGAGAAAGLFTYDGTHPVNVVRVLGFFVALQLALLAGTALLWLPPRARRALPGLAALQELLALASPGRWLAALGRALPASQREAATRFAALAVRHRRLYGDVERWLYAAASQGFGVAFHVGALACALGLVALTDLAFGWSTTLSVDASTLERVTHALALPWSWRLPEAVPGAELIASTQYFRGAAPRGHDPLRSAPWWRFCLMCMAVYALAPRLALYAFARWRLRAALRRSFTRLPGVLALHERLESRLVETTAEEAEPPLAPRAAAVRPAASAPARGTRCAALVWSGFPLDPHESLRRLGWEATSVVRAGEGALATDAAAIEALRRAPRDEPVAVLVKSWEPPVLELQDFLRALRAALGDGRVVVLLPLAQDASGRACAPNEAQLAVWRRAAEQAGDPWLLLHAPELAP